MSSTIDNCNTHDLHTHHTSLFDRLWSKLTTAANNQDIINDSTIKQKLLRDQQLAEIQNQARRTADIHRMIMRHI